MAATSALAALPVVGSLVFGSVKVCMKGSKSAYKASKLIASSASGSASKVKRLADTMYKKQGIKKAVKKISRGVSAEATETAFKMNKGKKVVGKSGKASLINIDEIRPKLKTEPNTAFFWSGRTDGIGGAGNAANIAKSRGGVTLESTIEAQGIAMPEWDFDNPSTMEAWNLASRAYAEQVTGEIRAVIGAELRSGNIWENVELPRLMRNPNVTRIITIDPKTSIEKIIFER